jgi:hypothetical protein
MSFLLNRRLDDFARELDFDQLLAVNGGCGGSFSGDSGYTGGSGENHGYNSYSSGGSGSSSSGSGSCSGSGGYSGGSSSSGSGSCSGTGSYNSGSSSSSSSGTCSGTLPNTTSMIQNLLDSMNLTESSTTGLLNENKYITHITKDNGINKLDIGFESDTGSVNSFNGTIYVVQSVNNTMTVSSKSISYSGEYASLWAYDMDIGSYKNLIGVVVDYSISGKGNTKTGTISWEK